MNCDPLTGLCSLPVNYKLNTLQISGNGAGNSRLILKDLQEGNFSPAEAGRIDFRQSNDSGQTIYYDGETDYLKFDRYIGGTKQTPSALVIKNDDGNVGIGTNTPTQRLDVDGRVKAKSFGLANTTFTTNGNDIFLNTSGSSNIFFRPNGDGNPLNQVVIGPTNTSFNQLSATGANVFNLNVSNGFNAPKAFADLYGVNLNINGVVSKGPIKLDNPAKTDASWTIRPIADGKLCFALNGTNKMCFNSSGTLVAPTAPF